jgi:hypothetical protein
MEGPISFWGFKKQESNLILPEHDDDDDDDDDDLYFWNRVTVRSQNPKWELC